MRIEVARRFAQRPQVVLAYISDPRKLSEWSSAVHRGEFERAAEHVAEAERALYAGLASVLTDRQLDALIAGLRRLVDERPAGAAIARRR
jgi:hypothetical protein